MDEQNPFSLRGEKGAVRLLVCLELGNPNATCLQVRVGSLTLSAKVEAKSVSPMCCVAFLVHTTR